MERKTFLYQPSQSAPVAPYSNISAPAGAFGDVSGSMANFGQGLQSVGESVGRIGQIRQQLQNRKDQDSKARGIDLTRASIERVDAEYAESVKAQSLDDPAFKAYQAGSSSEWKLKRQAEVFQDLAKEQKWTPPQDEIQSKEFRLGQGLLLDRVRKESAKEDSDRLFQNRTATRIDFDRAAFETLVVPEGASSQQTALDLYKTQSVAAASESGTDKNIIGRRLHENLAVYLRKNPVLITATAEEREKLRPQLIDAGFPDDFIKSYLDKTNPELMDRADYMLTVEQLSSNPEKPFTAKELNEFITTGYSSVKNFGETDRSKIVGYFVERNIRFGPFAASSIKSADIKSVDEAATVGTDEAVHKFWSERVGKELADYLTVDQRRQYFKLVQENAEQVKTQIRANPALFAESRTDGLIQHSNDSLAAIQAGDKAALENSLSSYRELALSTITSAGLDSEVDPDRPIIPPAVVNHFATAAKAGELVDFFEVVGPGAMRQVASAMPVGSKKAVATVLGSIPVGSKFPRNAGNALNALNSIPDNDPRIKAFREAIPKDLAGGDGKPVSYLGTVNVAMGSVTADGAYPTFAKTLSGQITDVKSSASVSDVVNGISNAQGFDIKTRNESYDSFVSLIESIAASYMTNGGYSAGAAMHQAAKDVINLTYSAGLVTATKRKNGAPFTLYYPVEESKSRLEGIAPFGLLGLGDNPGAENNKKLDEALSVVLDSLNGVPARIARQGRRPFYSGLAEDTSRFWSASTFGIPVKTEVSSYISLDAWKAAIPGFGQIAIVDGMDRFNRRIESSSSKFYPDKKGNLVFASSEGAANALTARGQTGRVTAVSDALVVTPLQLASMVDYSLRADAEEMGPFSAGSVSPVMLMSETARNSRNVAYSRNEAERVERSIIRMTPYYQSLPNTP